MLFKFIFHDSSCAVYDWAHGFSLQRIPPVYFLPSQHHCFLTPIGHLQPASPSTLFRLLDNEILGEFGCLPSFPPTMLTYPQRPSQLFLPFVPWLTCYRLCIQVEPLFFWYGHLLNRCLIGCNLNPAKVNTAKTHFIATNKGLLILNQVW